MDNVEEVLRDVLAQVKNLKAWALGKAEGVENRIAESGGEPSKNVADLVDRIRAECASEEA